MIYLHESTHACNLESECWCTDTPLESLEMQDCWFCTSIWYHSLNSQVRGVFSNHGIGMRVLLGCFDVSSSWFRMSLRTRTGVSARKRRPSRSGFDLKHFAGPTVSCG